MYASPSFVNYAVGDEGLEITRLSSHQSYQGWEYGTYHGLTSPDYNTIEGARLITIFDSAFAISPTVGYWEWLLAHEIAHSAGRGTADGGFSTFPPGDPVYQEVTDLYNNGVVVSGYGAGSADENHADAVSFYLTQGEAIVAYFGSSINLNIKTDFPALYNVLKDGYFDGQEF
jgi:hypothetical protein